MGKSNCIVQNVVMNFICRAVGVEERVKSCLVGSQGVRTVWEMVWVLGEGSTEI